MRDFERIYDQTLNEIKNRAQKNAKEDITKLYEALKKEGLESRDAGDKIRHDLVDTYSRTTIYNNLPEEAKRKYEKQQLEAKSNVEHIAHKKVIEITTTGQEESGKPEPSAVVAEEPNAKVYIPTNIFDKNDIVEIGPQTITLEPNPIWRATILQRMNQGAKVYLVIKDGQVTDVRVKP